MSSEMLLGSLDIERWEAGNREDRGEEVRQLRRDSSLWSDVYTRGEGQEIEMSCKKRVMQRGDLRLLVKEVMQWEGIIHV